jgi:dCTP deaminase
VYNKSTLARRFIIMPTTVAEPGWRGYLTLEIANLSCHRVTILEGMPIAQVVFEFLDEPTKQPYEGKYQDQEPEPVPAR